MKKLLLALSALTIVAFGGDFEDGIAAYYKKDYEKAAEFYQKASDQGDAVAQFSLASMYADGKGVKQDYKKALDMYQNVANQGFAGAQYQIALMYEKGTGVKQDYKKAVELYLKGAEQGGSDSLRRLADMYEKGTGVKQDHKKAEEFLRRANGKGTTRSFAEFLHEAADKGDAASQYDLGICYHDGTMGAKKDKIKAYKYWMEAAKQGHSDAQNNLDVLCKDSPWACK